VVNPSKASCNYNTSVCCSYQSLIKDDLHSHEVYLNYLFVCVHTSVSYPLDLFFLNIIKHKQD